MLMLQDDNTVAKGLLGVSTRLAFRCAVCHDVLSPGKACPGPHCQGIPPTVVALPNTDAALVEYKSAGGVWESADTVHMFLEGQYIAVFGVRKGEDPETVYTQVKELRYS